MKSVSTPVKLCFDKVMLPSESEDLGITPILARSGPFNTNNTPSANDEIREDFKIIEKRTEERAVIMQLLQFDIVAPPNVNGLIDILPRRPPPCKV